MESSCYIPNNPQYGLQLECQWTSQNGPVQCNSIIQLPNICQDSDLESLSQLPQPLSPSGVIAQPCSGESDAHQNPGGPTNTCWGENNANNDNDMGSFSMPLDLEPLPTLFPFSPCTAAVYKTETNCSPTLTNIKEKPVHDMADVLLSLKHAVVHPGQTELNYHHQQQPAQQLSYTVHPHQMLMSPNGYTTYCEQLPSAGYQTNPHHQNAAIGPQIGAPPAAIFPSMSVNVSMNMTYHPSSMPSYEQMQWGSAPQNTSPTYAQNPSLLSPTYTGGATYSFTADFRPPNVQEVPLLSSNSSFKPILNAKAQFSPVRTNKPQKMGFISPGKFQMMCEEDNQRPNLCRICGKTYARPSTLKTHLRTHSGEKPYKCIDCNKSFSQAANLTAHVRTHSGEKPFRCPICDRRFSQSSSVTTHMRTHSGERPYRCRMCKKAFSDSSTLTKHLRIHSGEKPYQCKLCLLRFSQSGNLNRHMRVHGTNNPLLL